MIYVHGSAIFPLRVKVQLKVAFITETAALGRMVFYV